jgi:hypothetical protein
LDRMMNLLRLSQIFQARMVIVHLEVALGIEAVFDRLWVQVLSGRLYLELPLDKEVVEPLVNDALLDLVHLAVQDWLCPETHAEMPRHQLILGTVYVFRV